MPFLLFSPLPLKPQSTSAVYSSSSMSSSLVPSSEPDEPLGDKTKDLTSPFLEPIETADKYSPKTWVKSISKTHSRVKWRVMNIIHLGYKLAKCPAISKKQFTSQLVSMAGNCEILLTTLYSKIWLKSDQPYCKYHLTFIGLSHWTNEVINMTMWLTCQWEVSIVI